MNDERTSRLLSLDALRGLIMVLMALDHANHFVAQRHSPGEYWGGAFPSYSDPLTFLTRLVTHPVAPGFMFLMGVGMTLFAHSRRRRGWTEWEITRHFLIRGGLLMLLQLSVVNLAWRLGPVEFPAVYIGVLFALGGGMMLSSLAIRLRAGYLAALAGVLFVGTELLHPDPSQWGAIFDQPLGLVFGYSGGNLDFWSNYPILPWLELILFGMAFGLWLLKDPRRAFNTALALGAAALVAFVILRNLDGFGNIRPRSGDSWIDRLNVVKYPPSMTFTLLTMGFNLLILWLFSRTQAVGGWLLERLAVFGRAPLFFYVIHLYLYLVLGGLFAPTGTSIAAMYPYWLLGLLILYPLTRWYGAVKHRRPTTSVLRYL